MSKEAALAMATGSPVPVPANPSLVVTPEPTTESPKDLDSARFAAQARKESEFVKKQQAFKAEQEEYAKRKIQVDEILKKRDQFEDTRKKDPVAALRLIGFNETEILNFLAAQEKPDKSAEEIAREAGERAAQEKIDAFEKKRSDEAAKETADRDTQLLAEYKTGLSGFVDSNKEKYEYCSYFGPAAIDLAYRTVLQVVEDSKGTDIPTIEEAIQMAEDYYEEEDKALMSSIKKRQPKTDSASPEENKPVERSRTVSTPAGATPVAPPIQKTRPLSNAARPTTASASKQVYKNPEEKKAAIKADLAAGLWDKYRTK